MIIDTSVMVWALERRDPNAIAVIRDLGAQSVRSFVVEGELTAGVESPTMVRLGQTDIELRRATADAYRELSERPDELPLDVLASRFAWLTAVASDSGLKVGQNDRWIVAEALTLGVGVLTADGAMNRLGYEAARRLEIPGVTTLVEVESP